MVVPCYHRSGRRSASLAASRGLLLGRGVNERGQVPGRQVGQLHCQLCVLHNGVGQVLLLPKPNVVALLDPLCILGNVWATGDLAAGADVLKVKHHPMLVAAVSKSKVDTGAIFGSGPHEVTHDAWNVEGQFALGPLGHVVRGLSLRSTASVYLFHSIASG